ncbi:lamin tail domain-containing protein [Myxococcota bacterium]|nr:lamin tail domain-containing protein [Myxococcota bacterium]
MDGDCDGEVDEGLTFDLDGDGHSSIESCGGTHDDCNDADPAVSPSAAETCDGVDEDCDGEVDDGLTFDADADGFTSLASCEGSHDDCDDADATAFPGAVETCNGVDEDCDGAVDDGLTFDADADGFTSLASCEGTHDDCDDADATAFPGAVETCDGVDDDCDGAVDEGLTFDADADGYTSIASCEGTHDDCDDADATVHPDVAEICDGVDDDCDGVVPYSERDQDGDGLTPCDGDCNDQDAAAWPGAAERCNGLDDDCDGEADEGLTADADADGYTSAASCGGTRDDCDDADPAVNPAAAETCDGVDQDCDGGADDGLTIDADGDGHSTADSCDGTRDDCDDGLATVYAGAAEICDGLDDDCDGAVDDGLTFDVDADGHTSLASCEGTRDDCDDADPAVNPAAVEICDGVDQDCDGGADDGLTFDADGDGHSTAGSCEGTRDDCDDGLAAVYAGAVEVCDGLDDDCDGAVDDGLTFDADADGHTSLVSCEGTRDDCDDADPTVNPAAAEICDGIDQDCDGGADDGLTVDDDGDGYSTPASCGGTTDDCDDTSAYTHPGALEYCDGADNDCNGLVPRGERDADGDGQRRCEADCNDQDAATYDGAPEACDGTDNDCDEVVPAGEADADGDGYALCAGDCDDAEPLVNPGLAEVCGDGLDNDCGGVADDGCPVAPVPGSLVISEVMINPTAAVDNRGEWFEVLNLSGDTLDLDGVTVASNGGSRTLNSTVLVAPGGYAVLGRNGNLGQNGGVTMDALYGNAVLLDNGTDTLTLTAPGGALLDAFGWGVGDAPTGASLTLSDGALDPDLNDDVALWCLAESTFGAGDLGTPGAPNDHCPMVVTPVAGDLVITEILADPQAVLDSLGEWFEVANVGADILELEGVTLSTTGGSATIAGSLQVPVGGYAVLGRYGNPFQNGDVVLDYVYGNGPSLAEGGDSLTITAPGGALLDAFAWGAGAFSPGVALSLDPGETDDLANDDIAAWCPAVDGFGAGDLGTPGFENPSCGP